MSFPCPGCGETFREGVGCLRSGGCHAVIVNPASPMSIDEENELDDILEEVASERVRQQGLKAAGKFAYTCQDPQLTSHEKLAILAEEFGEVARAVCEADRPNLREELIQVAAVCVAWVQGLDAEKAP